MQGSHISFEPPLKFPLAAIPDDFGAALRDARRQRGWTQAKLAASARLERLTVVRLEASKRKPSADTVFRIRQALDLLPTELVPAWPEWNPIGLSTYGARTRERRRELGVSLDRAAAETGVSASTLSRFEREQGNCRSLVRTTKDGRESLINEGLAMSLGFKNCREHADYCLTY